MSMESLSSNESSQLPKELLIQEALTLALSHESVVEVINYDFFENGNGVNQEMPLGVQGIYKCESPSPTGSTHRITLSNIPEESNDKVYIVGFPYWDKQKYEEAISRIYEEQSDEKSRLFRERARRDDNDEYPTIQIIHEESMENWYARLSAVQAKQVAYNLRQARKWDAEYDEDRELDSKYDIKRLYVEVQPELKYETAFFMPTKNSDGKHKASVDFSTDVDKATLYLPFNPLPFESFKDKHVLQLFTN